MTLLQKTGGKKEVELYWYIRMRLGGDSANGVSMIEHCIGVQKRKNKAANVMLA